MRLIDERELICRISELPDLRTMSTATIGKIIKECTTIDAAPVVHAKWIRNEFDPTSFRCSACGGEVIGWHHLAECTFNGCPWCLARMDGGVSDG